MKAATLCGPFVVHVLYMCDPRIVPAHPLGNQQRLRALFNPSNQKKVQVSYVKRGIQQVSQEVDENCRHIGLEPVEIKENENTYVISGCNNPGKIASAANNCAVASI